MERAGFIRAAYALSSGLGARATGLRCLLWLALLPFGCFSSWAVAPSNDLCSGAMVIPAAGPFPFLTATVDVTDASTGGDPGSPSCAAGVSRSVWYKFSPSATALYTLSVSDDTGTTVPDTVMAIYSSAGGCAGPFTPVDCNDDAGGLRSAISATLSSGVSYYIVVWVSSFSAPLSNGHSTVQLRVSRPAVPANDTCAGAEVIPGSGPFPWSTGIADTSLASTAGDPPAPLCQASFSRSVWYKFTPAVSTTYTVSTCSDTATTIYDTLLGVYTANAGCGGPYTAVACNDNSCGFRAAVTTALSAGTTYYIVVWESGSSPYTPGETSVQLRISGLFPPVVATVAASSVTSTSAVLNALVNPSGAATTAWFDWGTSTNYANSTAPQSLGSGSSTLTVSASVSGLSTAAYFFRIHATNVLGASFGTNLSLAWSSLHPAFSLIAPSSGIPALRFTGAPGQLYLVQGSTNLLFWSNLGTATESPAGSFNYSDSSASTLPRRFYRVLAP